MFRTMAGSTQGAELDPVTHRDHLAGLLKCSSWRHPPPPPNAAPDFLIQQAGVGWGLRSCIFNKFPGDSDADGLGPWSEYLDIEQE